MYSFYEVSKPVVFYLEAIQNWDLTVFCVHISSTVGPQSTTGQAIYYTNINNFIFNLSSGRLNSQSLTTCPKVLKLRLHLYGNE